MTSSTSALLVQSSKHVITNKLETDRRNRDDSNPDCLQMRNPPEVCFMDGLFGLAFNIQIDKESPLGDALEFGDVSTYFVLSEKAWPLVLTPSDLS